MKGFMIALALGTAAGLVMSEIPAVKDVLVKGKKKVKNITK